MMNPHVEVEIARRTLVDGCQSFKYMPGDSWGVVQNVDRQKSNKNPPSQWNALPTRILTASPHLQGYDVPGEEIDRLKAEGLTLLEALEELGMS